MTMRLQWLPRTEPLAGAAVAGAGPARTGLTADAVARLRAGAGLRAVADADWIVFLGDEADLPWADGVTYLGWEGGLLLPTALRPSIAADLLRRAIDRTAAGIVAVLPGAILYAGRPVGTVDPAALVS